MNTSASLQQLLQRPDLWRGRHPLAPRTTALPSGYPALDRALHQGGWPRSGVTELLSDAAAPALLPLLLPGLAAAAQRGQVLLARPPAEPLVARWQSEGIAAELLWVLDSADPRTLLRAVVDAAASGAVAALLFWPIRPLSAAQLRRLHQAAHQGRCWLTLWHPLRSRAHSSPAPLRLCAHIQGDALQLELLKQPGGWAGQQLTLPWPAPLEPSHTPLALAPVPHCMAQRPRLTEMPAPALPSALPATWPMPASATDSPLPGALPWPPAAPVQAPVSVPNPQPAPSPLLQTELLPQPQPQDSP